MRRRVKKAPRDAGKQFDKGIEQTEQAIDKAIESVKEKKGGELVKGCTA